MEKIDVIKEIKNTKGYQIALMSTFNFEGPYFERYILNQLRGNGINKISLFIDEEQFNQNLKNSKMREIGKKYFVNTIRTNDMKAFHPKMMLFLGKNKAKFIIGSGNITMSGLCRNNEIFNVYEINEKDNEDLYYIKKAVEIFGIFKNISINPNFENSLFEEINQLDYLKQEIEEKQDSYIIHNYEENILQQVKNIITNDVIEEIKIAVPYYDKKLTIINELEQFFQCNTIKTYIQNGTSTYPLDIKANNEEIWFDTFSSKKSSNFYHGKVFLLKGKEKDYILYGSANCTNSALGLNFNNGGNFECDIFDIGEKDQFDYFFEDMIFENKDTEYKTREIEHREIDKLDYRFNYAYIKDGILISRISCANKNINKVIINENIELLTENYEFINNNILEISYKIDERFQYIPTFTITINDKTLNGWFADFNELNENRNNTVDFIDRIPEVYNFDIKSLRDKTLFLEKNIFTYQEYQEFNSIKNQYMMATEEEPIEEEEIELSDNYVVNVSLDSSTNELMLKKKQYDKIRGISTLFKDRVRENVGKYKKRYIDTINKKSENDEKIERTATNRIFRNATSEEKRFARFFKRRINEIFEEKYMQNVDVEHYISNLYVVIDVIYDFVIEKSINNIFDAEYIIETIRKIIEIIIEKPNYKEVDKTDKEIVELILFILLIINKEINYARYNSIGSKLLNKYDKAEYIRDDYENVLDCALYIYNCDIRLNKYVFLSDMCNDFENLFNYKSQERFNEFLSKELYRNEYEIVKENDNIQIIVDVIDFNGFNSVNNNVTKIMLEVKKYFKQNDVKTIILHFKKQEPLLLDKPKEAMEIKYSSNINDNSDFIEKLNIRKDGSVDSY